MSGPHVPADLRHAVIERANRRCEYCLFPQEFSFASFEMEHIVAEKHGGATALDNLALACQYCNRHKGTDLGSLDTDTGQFSPFYNPRTQGWQDHFRLDGARIVPLSPEGRVTVSILQMNHPDRISERERMIRIGRFP